MKKIAMFSLLFLATTSAAFAQVDTTTDIDDDEVYDTRPRALQIGADVIVPYQVSDPRARTATLVGGHAEFFPVPTWSIGVEIATGVDDRGYAAPGSDTEGVDATADNPTFVTPGFGFYPTSGRLIDPFLRADAPFLVNNGQDFGLRGGLGFLLNTGLAGLGLKYSFDAGYFFDAGTTFLNLAHVSAVFNW